MDLQELNLHEKFLSLNCLVFPFSSNETKFISVDLSHNLLRNIDIECNPNHLISWNYSENVYLELVVEGNQLTTLSISAPSTVKQLDSLIVSNNNIKTISIENE